MKITVVDFKLLSNWEWSHLDMWMTLTLWLINIREIKREGNGKHNGKEEKEMLNFFYVFGLWQEGFGKMKNISTSFI